MVVVLLGAAALVAGEFALRGGHSLTLLSGAALSACNSSGGDAAGAVCNVCMHCHCVAGSPRQPFVYGGLQRECSLQRLTVPTSCCRAGVRAAG